MTSTPARTPRPSGGVEQTTPGLPQGDSFPAIAEYTIRKGADPSLDLSRVEWLLTDGSGGLAMGTVEGIPTRRYHAWHIPALHPPVGRVALLHSVLERIVVTQSGSQTAFELASFRFPGGVTHPRGGTHLVEFRKSSTSAAWTYRFGTGGVEVTVVRELALTGPASAAVRYHVTTRIADRGDAVVQVELRPLVALRDFHELCVGRWGRGSPFTVSTAPGVVSIRRAGQEQGPLEIPELHLAARSSDSHWRFGPPAQWWNDFEYDRDRERGQDFKEDLFSPGVFLGEEITGSSSISVELHSWIGEAASEPPQGAIEAARRDSLARVGESARFAGTHARDGLEARSIRALCAAASQFVVRRAASAWSGGSAGGSFTSVIAGYPWFSDWGRDSMISLPGLLLATGDTQGAASLLEGFARMARGGLVPNCFDNGTGEAEYNTVDASLWYINAAVGYFKSRPSRQAEEGPILAAALAIVESYQRGAQFGIRIDPVDGLVCAGNPSTQLTWMDARRDGVVFTPRAGKPVEINALWYNALAGLADVLEDVRPRTARDLRQSAERVRASFQSKFFDAYRQMCFDLVPGSAPHGGGDHQGDPAYQVRPNQIFAVSLAHSPLNAEQSQAVVRSVRQSLLTPMGLRTLSPSDRDYQGRFEGSLFARDRAYHNGTVWPWLMGPFAEAVLRVGQFSQASRSEARMLLAPLVEELQTPGHGRCVGQLAEVYDGDDSEGAPRRPDGCVAQAWSVAEVLRVLVLCGEKTG